MQIVRREWCGVSREAVFRVLPLGDVHIASAACDEQLFTNTVARIAGDPDCWWIGMGDYCEWINRNDPRFDPACLAPWITVADLVDLSKAQRDRFLDIVKPIAAKCLTLLEGNHEATITRYTERAIFSEIVTAIKQ